MPVLFSFLHPSLLWGLSALAIPIILHFLFRRPERRVSWAAMDLLGRALEATAKNTRRRERWLLVLRLVLLALLAVALASPLFPGGAFWLAVGAEAAPVVLVVDGSLSMRARGGAPGSLFESAREQALDLVRAIPDGAAVSVVLASSMPRVAARDLRSKDAARGAIRSLAPTWRGDDDAATGRLVDSLGPGAQVHWLSGDARDGALSNAAVERIEIEPEGATLLAGRAFRVDVSVRGFARSSERELALSVDGIERERRRVSVQAHGVSGVSFDVMIDAVGIHDVAAALDPDAMAFDDSRTLPVFVRGPLSVWLVQAREASEPPYLEAALRAVTASSSRAGSVAMDLVVSPVSALESGSAAIPGDAIAVLSGISRISSGALAALGASEAAGPAVMAFVEPDAAPAASISGSAEALASILPVALDGPREAQENEPARIVPVDTDHPLLRPLLSEDPAALERVLVRRWQAARPVTGARVIARIEPGGDPALVELRERGLRRLAFLIAADVEASDLPLPSGRSHLLVPLVAAGLERLAPPAPLLLERTCGQSLGVDRPGLTLVDADGAPLDPSLLPDLPPGIYRLAGDGIEGRVALVPDPSESDPTSLSRPGSPISVGSGLVAAGQPLLALAAALLVIESVLAALASREKLSR